MDFRFAWAPSGKALFFEHSFRGARNLWRMTVDPATLQPTNIDRLTTSAGLDAEPSVSPDGTRLAFTSERQQIRAWAFPFDANHGRVTGRGEPVTSAGIEAWSLDLSRDGKKLGVWGVRDGKMGVWETSVPNGREKPLVATDSYYRSAPIWSPDGKRAAYERIKDLNGDLVGECQVVVWSSDNRTEDPVEPGVHLSHQCTTGLAMASLCLCRALMTQRLQSGRYLSIPLYPGNPPHARLFLTRTMSYMRLTSHRTADGLPSMH